MRASPVRAPQPVRHPKIEEAPAPQAGAVREEEERASAPSKAQQTDRSRVLEWEHDPSTAQLRMRIDAALDASKEPAPADEMLWNDEGVAILHHAGEEQGGLSRERAEQNRAVASEVLSNAGEPLSFTGGDVAQLLDAAGGESSRHSRGQLDAAARYVSRATTKEDQQHRLTTALDNLSIAERFGAPTLNEEEFLQAMWSSARIPGHAIDGFSQERRDRIFADVARATNTPGRHQLKIDNYRVNLTTGEQGLEATSTKRHSPWSTVGKIALNVGLGAAAAFTGGAALVAVRVASGVIGAVEGIKNRSVLGAIAGAAGAFGAVAGAIGASNVAQVASTSARAARAIDGGIGAARAGSWAGVIGAVADGAGVHHSLEDLQSIAARASTAASVVEGVRDREAMRAIGSGVSLFGGWRESRRVSASGHAIAAAQNGAIQASSSALGLFADPNGGRNIDRIARIANAASDLDLAVRSGDAGRLAEVSVEIGSSARSWWPSQARFEAMKPSPIDFNQLGEPISLEQVLALPEMQGRLLESRPIDITAIEPMPAIESGIHIVRDGETLQSIADRYPFTPEELMQENGLSDRTLEPGSALEIPHSSRLRVVVDALGEPRVKLLSREEAAREREQQLDMLRELRTSESFQELDPISRAHATRALTRAGTPDPELASDLRSLLDQRLDPDLRFELLESFEHLPLADDRRTLLSLTSTPGFSALSTGERMQLARLTNGSNFEVSEPARRALAEVLNSSTFRGDDAEGQAAQLARFLEEQPSLPSHAGVAGFEFPHTTARHRLSELPRSSPDTRTFEIEVEGRRIPLIIPSSPATTTPSPDEIARAVASIPPSERNLIDRIEVSPNPDPNAAYMRAGAAGVITIYPTTVRQSDRFLRESLIHETGHVHSRRLWGLPDEPAWDEWKRAMARDGLEASQYARTSTNRFDDDFAEHRLLYLKTRGTREGRELRELFPARWAILDRLFR